MTSEPRLTRRVVLQGLGAAGVVVAVGGVPGPAAAADPALGVHETAAAGLKRLFGSRPIKDGASMMKLEVPLIAENGAVVPVSVDVNLPMTRQSYVKHVYIVADQNRIPVVARAAFTPETGAAAMGANIRLGETGVVRAIAEQSDGTLYQVTRDVKVTVGGCGG